MCPNFLKKNLLDSISRKINKITSAAYSSGSFSQFGEDLIIDQALNIIREEDISYLDIGANHPYSLSNTYFFYRKGFSGTLVEPDPYLCKKLYKRKRDRVLNYGVSFGESIESAKLYIMNPRVLNTFSLKEAKRIEKDTQYKIIDTVNVKLIPINILLESYLSVIPSVLSIDVEGLDFDILNSINFEKYRIPVVVAETLTFDPLTGGRKLSHIIDLMIANDYQVFADTRCNTVFVDNRKMPDNA